MTRKNRTTTRKNQKTTRRSETKMTKKLKTKKKKKREKTTKREMIRKTKTRRKGKKEDTKKKEPENGTTRKPDPKALASSPRAVSFVDSNPKADTHRSDPSKDQELIKSLQKELDEERKKVKSLEARIADLEKKSSKGASSNNKKGSKPSKK